MSAPRNRTMTLCDEERSQYRQRLLRVENPIEAKEIRDRTILGDVASVAPLLPSAFADLMVVDPPYNLNKRFAESASFSKRSRQAYAQWMDAWLSGLVRCLKPEASVYICGDWRSSGAIEDVCERYFTIRSRITWEREKGRGARANWKNAAEDIWFATVSERYTFNIDAVKLKRRVRAPYRHANGEPKDWESTDDGNGYRLTHPSNLWTDLTVPFWSMPENTEHPTQKPEKLLAKIILASSNEGDCVFDPFLGSGTTSVAAKKLGRHYVGIECDETFACLAEKRLERASADRSIQGVKDGVFFERNSE